MRKIALFLAFLPISWLAHSQVIDFRYHGFLDNREYFNEFIAPQTIFGNRASAALGFQFDSINAVYVGGSYLYEFGSKGDLVAPDLTLYYEYNQRPFRFYFGSFPRHDKILHPKVLMTDTLYYFRPNVEGTFLEVAGGWGHQNVWIDWLSRQSLTKEEIFLVGYSGNLNFKPGYLKSYFIMQHIAGTANPDEPHNLRDNGGAVLSLGADLSSYLFFDKFSIDAGGAYSYDQLRGVYDLKHYFGFIGNLKAEYKILGLEYTFYRGEGQVQTIGDSFYKSKKYMRLDGYIVPYRNQNMFIRAQFGFHFLPGLIDFSQQLTVVYLIDDHKIDWRNFIKK